ncbi:hypothetical protein BC629DRAFT_705330 [Irpex lacteus]|nr:hypothetical protein BC629DRAFT_705330 [Irpex lacteus]
MIPRATDPVRDNLTVRPQCYCQRSRVISTRAIGLPALADCDQPTICFPLASCTHIYTFPTPPTRHSAPYKAHCHIHPGAIDAALFYPFSHTILYNLLATPAISSFNLPSLYCELFGADMSGSVSKVDQRVPPSPSTSKQASGSSTSASKVIAVLAFFAETDHEHKEKAVRRHPIHSRY